MDSELNAPSLATLSLALPHHNRSRAPPIPLPHTHISHPHTRAARPVSRARSCRRAFGERVFPLPGPRRLFSLARPRPLVIPRHTRLTRVWVRVTCLRSDAPQRRADYLKAQLARLHVSSSFPPPPSPPTPPTMSSSSASASGRTASGGVFSRSQVLNNMTLKRQPHKTFFMVSRGVDASSPPPASRSGALLRARMTTGGAAAPAAVYTSQGTYTGDWRENKRNGFGVQAYQNGERYEGGWSDNVRHGTGILYAPRHGALMRVYEGDFAFGKFHGRGTMYYANGDM
jgi:hypothetical protein